MSRRQFGTIQVRGNASIRVKYQASDGRQYTQTLPRGSNRRDAELLLARICEAQQRGTWVPPTALTVAEFLNDVWLPARSHDGKTKSSTVRFYGAACKRIVAVIGAVPIQQVTSLHIERVKEALQTCVDSIQSPAQGGDRETRNWKPSSGHVWGTCLSPKTVKETLDTGRNAWNWAKKHRLLTENPWDDVDRPTVPRHEAMFLTPQQALAYYAAALAEDSVEGRLLALGLLTAKRTYRELASLHWRDVDTDRRQFTVRWVLQENGQLRQADGPKGGIHVVSIPSQAAAIFEAQRQWQADALDRAPDGSRLFRSKDTLADRLVFCRPDGTYVPRTSVWKAHHRIAAACDLPAKMTIHDLRHTAASLLLAQGAEMRDIQAVLNHSNMRTTADLYTHLMPGRMATLLDGLARMVAGA